MLSGKRKREIDQEGGTGSSTAASGEETLRNRESKSRGREAGLQAQGSHMARDPKAITGSVGGPIVCPALGEHFGVIVPLSPHTTCVPGPITLLVSSGCYNKISVIGWLINNRIYFLQSGGWESKHGWVPAWPRSVKSPLLSCRQLPLYGIFTWRRESELALWSS